MISKKVKKLLNKLTLVCARCHGTGVFHLRSKKKGIEKCQLDFMPTCSNCGGSGHTETKDWDWKENLMICTLERYLQRKNKGK